MPYSQPSAYAFVTQFLICLVVILRPIAAVDIISSSKLETCIRNGTQVGATTAASQLRRTQSIKIASSMWSKTNKVSCGACIAHLSPPPVVPASACCVSPTGAVTTCTLRMACYLHLQGANSTAISCKQKVVVVVSVDSGDSISSQDVQFTLNCVGR
eukprot:GHRQ01023386.1.p1 GENE.GHRQ01023386.1~~GHRQ01023386.1.p1  ORF type:complete len:157 (+),score=15.03 GHRQ01023386.1:158-628(+)